METLSGLEQPGFINLLILGIGPAILTYGVVRFFVIKKMSRFDKIFSIILSIAGLLLTCAGAVYYWMFS